MIKIGDAAVSEEKIVRFGNDKSKLSEIANKYHEEAVFDKYLQTVKKRLDNDNSNYFIQSECLDELHKKWKNQVLQAVEITSKHLGGQYKNMTFKDWYKIVSELYRNMNG